MTRIELLTKRIEKLTKQKNKIDDELSLVVKKKQKICKHPRVKKSGGGIWHDWPDYGYYPYYLKCLECEIVVTENELDRNRDLYRSMDKKVVEDVADHTTFNV